jgi:hypothetical protein
MAEKRLATRGYTIEQVETGLLELALCAGNSRLAARRLAEQGLPIPRETLRDWSTKHHVDRYAELQAKVAPKIEAVMVGRFRENAVRAGEVAREAIEKIHEDVQAGEADAGKAFQQLMVGTGITLEKMMLLEGRPTTVIETRDTQQLLAELKEIAPSLVVESTAVDLTTTPTLPAAKTGESRE